MPALGPRRAPRGTSRARAASAEAGRACESALRRAPRRRSPSADLLQFHLLHFVTPAGGPALILLAWSAFLLCHAREDPAHQPPGTPLWFAAGGGVPSGGLPPVGCD